MHFVVGADRRDVPSLLLARWCGRISAICAYYDLLFRLRRVRLGDPHLL
jgi:hypothetical protein